MKRLGITGLTFHDLRGSAISYAYAEMIKQMSHGEVVEKIADDSGHTASEAEAIIRRFYLVGNSVVRAIQRSISGR